mmetsp:Transcript_43462/g.140970  ORF Transcript_43462/g.140970 Transcript_43462/m.140970 type:complete len:206 (-) Transcript_43462:101-718(-)
MRRAERVSHGFGAQKSCERCLRNRALQQQRLARASGSLCGRVGSRRDHRAAVRGRLCGVFRLALARGRLRPPLGAPAAQPLVVPARPPVVGAVRLAVAAAACAGRLVATVLAILGLPRVRGRLLLVGERLSLGVRVLVCVPATRAAAWPGRPVRGEGDVDGRGTAVVLAKVVVDDIAVVHERLFVALVLGQVECVHKDVVAAALG